MQLVLTGESSINHLLFLRPLHCSLVSELASNSISVYTCSCVYMCVWRPEAMSGAFLHCFTLTLTSSAQLASYQVPGIPLALLPQHGVTDACNTSGSLGGARDLNSGPHACKGSRLPAEPSSQALNSVFYHLSVSIFRSFQNESSQ